MQVKRGTPGFPRDLPSGQVTFFLTDIEGSTGLWEEHPEAMAKALARHDALLSDAIERNGGVILKARGEGDSVFAVFSSPREGVRAALHAQLEFQSATWPEPLSLRVRIAIHTGDAELRDRDYYGPVVNRSARLRAIAHGEQTILSAAAQSLLDEDMGDGLALRDLGWHRLRDLKEPEHVFQLCHPGLPLEFPPLLSLDLFPNNLPVQRTSLVGREKDIADLKELLLTASLVTLTGTGGAGKSRLAQQVAAETLDMFRSGAWLVELASLTEPDLVPQAVASAIGLRLQPGRPVIESILEFVAQKSLLLVLDNCEHLIGASAEVVDRLLNSSPDLKVLATSREPLQIPGEIIWRVPSLSVPDDEVQTVEDLNKFESVRLLVDRLSLSRPGSRLSAKDAPALTSISRRLDGIPLALELAAARAGAMPLSEIASRLDNRFLLLAGGARTALPRHQTLRAAVAWSYDLLSEEERVLLRRLSVFSGGFTLLAAQEICGTDATPKAIPDLVTRLVDKSLVNLDVNADSSRYWLLETIRQYATELLSESGEEEGLRARHLEWFLGEAERHESNLLAGDETRWLDELEPEHDNLRAALQWALAHRRGESGIKLAASMWLFWWLRGYVKEGIRWLKLALETSTPASEPLLAGALFAVSFLSYHDANMEDARRYAEQSLAAVESAGNSAPVWTKPLAQIQLGAYFSEVGDYEDAWEVLEEALKASRLLDLGWGLGFSLSISGGLAYAQGNRERARGYWEEMVEIQRERRIEVGLLIALQSVARLESDEGNFSRARTLYEESLEIRRKMGAKRLGFGHGGIVGTLNILGRIAYKQSDYSGARDFAEEALEIARGFDDRPAMANALSLLSEIVREEGAGEQAVKQAIVFLAQGLELNRGTPQEGPWVRRIAQALAEEGLSEDAALLFGALQARAQNLNLPPAPPLEIEDYERAVDKARAALRSDTFSALWDEGTKMEFNSAVELALKSAG